MYRGRHNRIFKDAFPHQKKRKCNSLWQLLPHAHKGKLKCLFMLPSKPSNYGESHRYKELQNLRDWREDWLERRDERNRRSGKGPLANDEDYSTGAADDDRISVVDEYVSDVKDGGEDINKATEHLHGWVRRSRRWPMGLIGKVCRQ
jgi:hypothetical protein